MILTCPNCGTQYVVKDGAIPPQGRQVRCASCKHSWHQDSEGEAEPEVEESPEQLEPEPELTAAEDESLAEATLIEPRSGPEAEERAYQEAAIDGETAVAAEPSPMERHTELAEDVPPPTPAVPVGAIEPETAATAHEDWREPPQPEIQDDDFSPFPGREDEAQPKRRIPLTKLLVVILLVAAAAAAFWFLAPPEWRARVGLASGGSSPLALVTTHMDRQRLESGNELLTVTGRVINPTDKDQQVPPLQAQLKTRAGQVVYSWTIAPPARSLPPGASASFNSAEVNVPPGGDELTITLGSGGA